MNPFKVITQNCYLRILVGVILSGATTYNLISDYNSLICISVPLSMLTAAFLSFIGEHLIEAIIKATLSGLILFTTLPMAAQRLTANSEWWDIILIGLSIGLFSGIIIGSILGAIFRKVGLHKQIDL